MFEELKGKKVQVFVESGSGMGVSTHSGTISASNIVQILGIVAECNEQFLQVKGTAVSIISPLTKTLGLSSRFENSSLDTAVTKYSAEVTYINLQHLLFINVI